MDTDLDASRHRDLRRRRRPVRGASFCRRCTWRTCTAALPRGADRRRRTPRLEPRPSTSPSSTGMAASRGSRRCLPPSPGEASCSGSTSSASMRAWRRLCPPARSLPRGLDHGLLPRHRTEPVHRDRRPSARGGLVDAGARLVLEKPLGHDLASAQAINDACRAALRRAPDLPHRSTTSASETVQNLMVLRFGNAIFEPLWRAPTSRRCRSRLPRRWASARAPASTTTPARCATWCRTTCCGCCASSRWSRRSRSSPTTCATRLKMLRSLRPIAFDELKRDTVRGQYAEGAVDAERARAYKGRRAARQRHRDLAESRAQINNALGRRAVLPPPASGCRAALGVSWIRARRAAVLDLRREPRHAVGPDRLLITLQPEVSAPADDGQGARIGHDDAPGVPRPRPRIGVRGRRCRSLLSSHDRRRQGPTHALHAPRRARTPPGVGPTRSARLAAPRRQAAALPGRQLGPGGLIGTGRAGEMPSGQRKPWEDPRTRLQPRNPMVPT